MIYSIAMKCLQCSAPFQISEEELQLLKTLSPKIGEVTHDLPTPTLCPDCRRQRRFAFRNERTFYHRKCEKTGKQVISVYPSDSPYTVYEQETWRSAAYDPLAYGRDFDFGRPFFEQFQELNLAVPKAAIQHVGSKNSDYVNYSVNSTDCHMLVGGLEAVRCLYSYRIFYSSDIVDCYDLYKCQWCYECSESAELKRCAYCVGCTGLTDKRFYIDNKPYSEKDYWEALKKRAKTADPFALRHSKDCLHSSFGENDKQCMDVNFGDNCERNYECTNLEQNVNVIFGMLVWFSKDCFYCMNTFDSKNCFGCSGLKNNEYCILNTQYTKSEYERLVPQIVDRMCETGEWGEFFPMAISPFAYNETVAQEHFPMKRTDAIKQHLAWADERKSDQYFGPSVTIPSSIDDVEDDICTKILRCSVTEAPYTILPLELSFYRRMKLALPTRCAQQRHVERMALLTPPSSSPSTASSAPPAF